MIAINGIVVTDAMKDAGAKIASDCMDASLQSTMGGMGGCREYCASNFGMNSDLVVKYIENEINSVEAIYLAMERAK